ncbi:MerR family transcriptional regulator [Xylanimonas ulmi]|uniref:MerR-like DNA binding protein n=1 Tax=Xylanimonas ulmi TaxID=228973 RepID=A0A4Q7M2Q7_9MICO|nr:MerR-like DNA binding protein [Xylanibacterium ulmi]
MRISALSERTGVPVATLKYYLREGLVPPGRPTAATQAAYDAGHVERVRLVRALTQTAGLALADVRRVLGVLDNPPADRLALLGAAQEAMLGAEATASGPGGEDPWPARVAAGLAELGWDCDPTLAARLAAQLRDAQRAGVAGLEDGWTAWARASRDVALADLASVPGDEEGAVRQVVVGTLLTDPVLATLRRIAQREVATDAAGVREADVTPEDASG